MEDTKTLQAAPVSLRDRDRALLAEVIDTIVARARELVVITDADVESPVGPTIEFVNAAAEKVIGLSRNELIGQPLGKIVVPEGLPRVLAQIRKVHASGEPLETELKAQSITGKDYWIELSITPVFGPDGKIAHFVRMGRDITARKHAMQQRDMTQRLLASVFGTIDNPLLVANASGKIMMANSAVARHFGWNVFDTIGKPVSMLLDGTDKSQMDMLIASERPAGQMRRFDARLLHRDGTSSPGELEVTVVEQPDSQTYNVIKLQPILDVSTKLPPVVHQNTAFEQAIRRGGDVSGAPTALVAGKLQLVGLEAVREKLADRWAEVAERAFTLAERVIQRYLQPGDIYRRSTDDGFLIFFNNLSEAEAQFKASAIGAEIRERLMGDIPEAMEAQVAAFAASVEVHPAEAVSEDAIIDLLGRRLEEERALRESRAQEAARTALRTAKPIFQSALTDRQQTAPLMLACLPPVLREPIETLQSLGRTPLSLEMEVFLLAGTGERMLAGLSKQPSDLILTPVRVVTLSQPRDLETWLKVARTLGDMGRRQVVAEVTEVPCDIAQIRMRDIAMRLSSLFRSVAFELPVSDPSFVATLPDSTRLATISARHLMERDGTVTSHSAKMVKALALRNCRLIVKDVDLSQAVALAKSDVPLMIPVQNA